MVFDYEEDDHQNKIKIYYHRNKNNHRPLNQRKNANAHNACFGYSKEEKETNNNIILEVWNEYKKENEKEEYASTAAVAIATAIQNIIYLFQNRDNNNNRDEIEDSIGMWIQFLNLLSKKSKTTNHFDLEKILFIFFLLLLYLTYNVIQIQNQK